MFLFCNWKSNSRRCPLFFREISSVDPRWNLSEEGCIRFLHEQLVYSNLNKYSNLITKEKFNEVCERFNISNLTGFDMDKVFTLDLDLIKR